jgi:hypothetical protein
MLETLSRCCAWQSGGFCSKASCSLGGQAPDCSGLPSGWQLLCGSLNKTNSLEYIKDKYCLAKVPSDYDFCCGTWSSTIPCKIIDIKCNESNSTIADINCIATGVHPKGYPPNNPGAPGFDIEYGYCLPGSSVCDFTSTYQACSGGQCMRFTDPCMFNECQKLGVDPLDCPDTRVISNCGGTPAPLTLRFGELFLLDITDASIIYIKIYNSDGTYQCVPMIDDGTLSNFEECNT